MLSDMTLADWSNNKDNDGDLSINGYKITDLSMSLIDPNNNEATNVKYVVA